MAKDTKRSASDKADDKQADDKQAESTTGRVGDSGPGTGREAPADETAARYPATTASDPDAAPLEPPADQATQTDPEHGHAESSTDQTAAESGRRSIAGENHVRLVGEDDNELSADSLFEDNDPNKTYVTTATRIYEVFTYPNTEREAKRLLYAEGRRVPRFQAERIKQAAESGA